MNERELSPEEYFVLIGKRDWHEFFAGRGSTRRRISPEDLVRENKPNWYGIVELERLFWPTLAPVTFYDRTGARVRPRSKEMDVLACFQLELCQVLADLGILHRGYTVPGIFLINGSSFHSWEDDGTGSSASFYFRELNDAENYVNAHRAVRETPRFGCGSVTQVVAKWSGKGWEHQS